MCEKNNLIGNWNMAEKTASPTRRRKKMVDLGMKRFMNYTNKWPHCFQFNIKMMFGKECRHSQLCSLKGHRIPKHTESASNSRTVYIQNDQNYNFQFFSFIFEKKVSRKQQSSMNVTSHWELLCKCSTSDNRYPKTLGKTPLQFQSSETYFGTPIFAQ